MILEEGSKTMRIWGFLKYMKNNNNKEILAIPLISWKY